MKIVDVETAPDVYIDKFLPREISTMSRCYGHPNVVGGGVCQLTRD